MARTARFAGAGFGVLMLLPALADCISDCDDAYQASVQQCRVQYVGAAVAHDLELCIDDARRQRDGCDGECRS